MLTLKEITALDTYSVRLPVLREGKPLETCHFEGDNLQSTIHLGLFINCALIGVVSLFKTQNSEFNEEKQFQIRGMAVLKHHQKRGYGEKLLHEAEEIAKKHKCNLLWFNAREKAVPFYEKAGYSIHGKPFEIGDIGTHFVMYRKTNPIS
jgi:GNAT superfamily N-acetyltransferase